eukprot:7774_1
MGNEKSKNSNVKSDEENDGVLLNKKYKYIYGKRRCQYRTEQLEISPDEVDLITKLQKNDDMKYDPYKQILSLSNNKPVKIIIDTDIGTDIDDVFTLLLLSHLPKEDVQILGITTNYRPTILRKHIAESILKQTKNNSNDLSSIPVIAGNCYLCGTHRPFYYAGNEGKGLGFDEKDNELMKKLWYNSDSEEAEDFIYQQLCKYPKEITIISIGIPTNIGNLINKYGKDKMESLIGHIVVMGGGSIMDRRGAIEMKGYGKYSGNNCNKWKTKWDNQNEEIKIEFNDLPNGVWNAIKWCTPNELNKKNEKKNVIHLYPNHNLSGDTLASVMMFQLKCPISLIPHHITRKHMLKGKAIETLLLLATKSDIKKKIYEDNENGICACLMREWFRVRRGQRCQCLHDPLTLYEAIYCKEAMDKGNDVMDENKDNDGEDDFELEKESCLRYCNGTIVVHEWAAFVTFVPDKNGPHRFAYKVINPEKWMKWCGDTMIKNVSQENVTENAGDYKKIMNTYGEK